MTTGAEPQGQAPDLGPIRVLFVEDAESDADAVLRRLRADGLDVVAGRVDNERDFVDALLDRPDVIISDLALPTFDERRALALSSELGPGVPFIVVSGTIGEDEAADLIDLGASDFVPKARLGRLPTSVRRCVLERRRSSTRTSGRTPRRDAETRFQREVGYLGRLLEASPDPMVIISMEGVITDVNKAGTRITGLSRARLLSSDFSQYLTDPTGAIAMYEQVLEAGSAPDVPMTVRHRDGTLTPVECTASIYRDADGTALGVIAIARDASLKKQAEATFHRLHGVASLGARAHRSTDLGAILADATETMVTLLPDLDSCELWRREEDEEEHRVLLTLEACSPSVAGDAPVVRPLAPGSMVDLALHTAEAVPQTSTPWRPAHGGAGSPGGLALAITSADSAWGVLVVHHHAEAGLSDSEVSLLRETAGIVAAAVSREDAASALWREARHDALTGLPNRAYFIETLEHALAQRGEAIVAVAILDLDDFKRVNDRYGHDVGDRLLVRVAARLAAAVRPSDMVARLGGDEFALLVPGLVTPEEMEPLVTRVMTALTSPLMLGGATLTPRGSVGWSTTEEAEPSVTGLLRGADVAMYEIKRSGKNAAAEYATRMSDAVASDAVLADELVDVMADELVDALDNGELVLHYQPQVDLRSGVICGVEALVRWAHPRRGLLAPTQFLSTADRLGLMARISAWVIDEACRWARTQVVELEGQPFVVSVNLAASDLENPHLPDIVTNALEANRLEPSRLCLEISESDMLARTVVVEDAVAALRRLGVSMSIDDFGTGYSSLAQMKRLPASALKIDREFVDGLGAELDDSAMVSSIISMAHAFSLDVVAEGVETVRQLDLLVELGCEYAQGFLLGPPMPADEVLPHAHVSRLFRRYDVSPGLESSGTPARVVIADDLEGDRKLLARTLTRSGHFTVVAEAQDGPSAIRLAQQHHPDLVVLDLDMPGRDGLNALKEIRATQPETPVVVLTGAASESTVRATVAAGAVACLAKGTMDVVPELVAVLRLPGVSGPTSASELD